MSSCMQYRYKLFFFFFLILINHKRRISGWLNIDSYFIIRQNFKFHDCLCTRISFDKYFKWCGSLKIISWFLDFLSRYNVLFVIKGVVSEYLFLITISLIHKIRVQKVFFQYHVDSFYYDVMGLTRLHKQKTGAIWNKTNRKVFICTASALESAKKFQ